MSDKQPPRDHVDRRSKMADSSPIQGIHFSKVEANGIAHRIATTRPVKTGGDRNASRAEGAVAADSNARLPLIMFLHGFPESWYSWRHQLLFFAERPYLAVAPDMRGYGSTDQPPSADDYTIKTISRDVVGIADVLGYDKFFVVGHDWGAVLAWHVALLHPERVAGVCAMSVPYMGRQPKGTLTSLSEKYGRCFGDDCTRDEKLRAKFQYMLHHNLPGVELEYDKNAREVLYRLYAFHPDAEVADGTPEVTDERMFPSCRGGEDGCAVLDATAAPGFWARIPRAVSLPDWLSPSDFEYLVSEMTRAGFAGGLRWYQALDMNWAETKELDGKKVEQPALFIAGDKDGVITMFGGAEAVREGCSAICEQLTDCVFLPGAGHWVQQERPQEVNDKLFEFLESIRKDGQVPRI